MEIKEIKHGNIVILQPDGNIDMRSSTDLERKVVELLDGGTRRLIVDFGSTEHLTSAGIRVLVMAGKRLDAADGGLVLCSLNEHVKSVFEVSGLTLYFRMVTSREEAIAQLHSESADKPSRLISMAMKLLGDESRQLKPKKITRDKRSSSLSSKVAELLSRPGSPRSSSSVSRKKKRQDGTSSVAGRSKGGETKS